MPNKSTTKSGAMKSAGKGAKSRKTTTKRVTSRAKKGSTAGAA